MGSWVANAAWYGAFVGTPVMLAFWYVINKIADMSKGNHSRKGNDSEGDTRWGRFSHSVSLTSSASSKEFRPWV